MSLIILLLVADNYMPFQSRWDFYSDNRVSSSACGRGYTGVASTGDISSVFINPASLSLENKLQYYFEYTYKNDIEWSANREFQELHPNFSVGHAFFINDFLQIGMTYRTEKSFSEKEEYTILYIPYGEIYPTDDIPYGWADPDWLINDSLSIDSIHIDTVHRNTDLKISSFSIPISINFKNIIRIGVDINYTTFYSELGYGEPGENVSGLPINFSKIIPKFGFIYSPIENLSFGITYSPKTSETITVETYFYNTYTYEPNLFPSKIGVGINYTFNPFPLSLSLDFIRYNNSIEENLVNRNDIHLGLEYDIRNNFKLRTGFFTQKDYRENENQEYYQIDNYNQIFTTLGLSCKIRYFTVNLSLMDSHLLSSGPIEQTYVNTGITYGF